MPSNAAALADQPGFRHDRNQYCAPVVSMARTLVEQVSRLAQRFRSLNFQAHST
jgi:hypothetical protein